MKLIIVLLIFPSFTFSQTIQLHYDLRGSVDPKHNAKNYPTIYFEYWKGTDSASILIKLQADLADAKGNLSKAYLQVAKTFAIYRRLQLHLSYSGGLGITEPRVYSYTITNTFQAGLSYPFKWNDAYLSAVLDLKYVPYHRPTADPIFTLYWYKGLHNYKMEFSGDFSIWTENKNHGDVMTDSIRGKRFSFFGEPQFWISLHKWVMVGSRVNLFYHVLNTDNRLQVYPTIGVRLKL